MRKMLDQIYEGKFYNFSYGFREGKSCHQAIREVNRLIMTKKINFIVDADIKGFFNNVDHEWLMRFLEHDIADKNFQRYIKRFLKAGIMEDMKYHESDRGTPQGGLCKESYYAKLWSEVLLNLEILFELLGIISRNDGKSNRSIIIKGE